MRSSLVSGAAASRGASLVDSALTGCLRYAVALSAVRRTLGRVVAAIVVAGELPSGTECIPGPGRRHRGRSRAKSARSRRRESSWSLTGPSPRSTFSPCRPRLPSSWCATSSRASWRSSVSRSTTRRSPSRFWAETQSSPSPTPLRRPSAIRPADLLDQRDRQRSPGLGKRLAGDRWGGVHRDCERSGKPDRPAQAGRDGDARCGEPVFRRQDVVRSRRCGDREAGEGEGRQSRASLW